MKPYSLDFRQKMVDSYREGEGSIRTIAKRFRVSADCVRRLLKQNRESGSIAPKGHGGGPQAKLSSTELEVLQTLVAEDNDATLVQLAQRLAQRTQVQVSSSTISRALTQLAITRKKKSQSSSSLRNGQSSQKSKLLETHSGNPGFRFSVSR